MCTLNLTLNWWYPVKMLSEHVAPLILCFTNVLKTKRLWSLWPCIDQTGVFHEPLASELFADSCSHLSSATSRGLGLADQCLGAWTSRDMSASWLGFVCHALRFPEGWKGIIRQILIRFPRQASAQPDLDYHTLSSAQRTCDGGKISSHFAFALGVYQAASQFVS